MNYPARPAAKPASYYSIDDLREFSVCYLNTGCYEGSVNTLDEAEWHVIHADYDSTIIWNPKFKPAAEVAINGGKRV